MRTQFEAEDGDNQKPALPLNREERRKKRWRPEDDLQANRSQALDRMRDTRSRASFVRRLGPR